MPDVGIVCDSTCDLGPDWLAAHGVSMVPLKVLFGERSYLDWVELRPLQFYDMLAEAPTLPKTSQPSPADFEAVYRELAASGCTGIETITLSAALSGTFESATLAAADSPVPVRVIDSRSVTQGTGLVVKAAIAARDAGGDADAVEAAARKAAAEVHVYFVLETMEYLVKGGRAGKAQAVAASLLNIKPVLHIDADGVIEPYKRARGMRNAVEEIAAKVAEDSKDAEMCVSLLTGDREDLVEMMREALKASGARYKIESVGMVGAVIGTYTGRDVIGVAYHPAR
jgi:DegV family protein with EDD domain